MLEEPYKYTYDLHGQPITRSPNSTSTPPLEFVTGSVRDSREGKGRFDLLPVFALTEIAKHFEQGGIHYGDRNWEKGQPLSRYLDSALRHTFRYLGGERDEKHAVAAAWNLLALIETEERIRKGTLPKELNDLP